MKYALRLTKSRVPGGYHERLEVVVFEKLSDLREEKELLSDDPVPEYFELKKVKGV